VWRVNRTRRRWLLVAVVAVIVSGGAVSYLASSDSDVAPIAGLRQLDLLYLDEPAPGLDRLGVEPGRPAVILFCDAACEPRTSPARRLCTAAIPTWPPATPCSPQPGGSVPATRSSTVRGSCATAPSIPPPGAHAEEIQILVDAVRGDR
jgi:hypothetical protein